VIQNPPSLIAETPVIFCLRSQAVIPTTWCLHSCAVIFEKFAPPQLAFLPVFNIFVAVRYFSVRGADRISKI
jgi:hypothetical protein